MASRRLMYAALAAACAAAIAVPVVLSQTGDDDGDGSTPSTEWPVQDTFEADLDGDGEKNAVRLRREGEVPGASPTEVEAELASGEVSSLLLPDENALDLAMAEITDIDQDEREELLLVQNLVKPADTSELLLVALDHGELVVVPMTREAPMASGFDERGRLQSWWIDRFGTLISSRSVDSFGYEATLPERYVVDMWTWSLQDEGLRPLKQLSGAWCGRRGSLKAGRCEGIPSILDEANRTIGVGETASIGDPIPTLSLSGEDGRYRLTYGLSGLAWSVALPPGPGRPRVFLKEVDLGRSDERMLRRVGFLVQWGTGEEAPMAVYLPGKRRLVQIPLVADIPPLGTVVRAERSFRSWVTDGGTLYTRELLNPGTNEYHLWSWTLTRFGTLAANDLGTWCLDYEKVAAKPC